MTTAVSPHVRARTLRQGCYRGVRLQCPVQHAWDSVEVLDTEEPVWLVRLRPSCPLCGRDPHGARATSDWYERTPEAP